MSFSPGASGGGGSIASSSDVSLNNPVNGQVLSYDDTLDKWKNESIASATIPDGVVTDAKVSSTAAIAQGKVAGLTADLAAKAPLADTPRYINFASGWSSRPNDNRMTFFLGGSATTDAPTDLNLQAGDIWIPMS